MTGQPNRPKRTFEHLEELTVEQLEELLSTGIELPDSDEEFIDAIVDTIVRKEHESLPDVGDAWRSFQEDFNTEEGEGLSLYPDDVEEERPSVRPAESKKARPKIRWNSLAVAAVILLVLAVTIAPPALGYRDFFAMVGHWNESIFSFLGVDQRPVASENPEEVSYDSLEEALEANGVTTPVVPAMLENYELVMIDVRQFPDTEKTNYNAVYESGETVISVYIIQRENSSVRRFERDESFIEEYEVNDVVHYISKNNDKLWAAWYNNNLECSLQGELSIDELKSIIDSIYERR